MSDFEMPYFINGWNKGYFKNETVREQITDNTFANIVRTAIVTGKVNGSIRVSLGLTGDYLATWY